MAQDNQAPGLSHVVMLAAAAVIVAALYLAQDVLVPIALSILFSFLFAPLVSRVERIGLSRIPAVLVVVVLASGIITGIGYLVTTQLISLTYQIPEYRDNIRYKVRAFRPEPNGGLTRVTDTFREISQELTSQPATAPSELETTRIEDAFATTPPPPPSPVPPGSPQLQVDRARPMPVEIIEPTSMWETVREALGYLAAPLGTAAIVTVLVIFMLMQREDLRDRFISLMGRGRVNVTTLAMDDAAQRISRYLLMQLIINATYGIPVGIALYIIGVPNALLWGLLATLLRYLPYVGPWIAASMPILLSLAVFDDWWHVSAVVAVFIVLELISNNIIEPWLYGASTGLSTVAVLVSALFWTWLWGPVGLFLATPMTACVVVIGKYIPQLEFLSVLLGDEPVFDPHTRFYQRLLAMDQEEAADLMEEHLEKATLLQAYDQFLIPAIHVAEEEYHRGRIDRERHGFILSTIRSMVLDLGESKIEEERREFSEQMRSDTQEPAAKTTPVILLDQEARPAQLIPDGFKVLCVPARDEADEIAALMLSQVLEAKGYRSSQVTTDHLKGELVDTIQESAPDVVCLSAMPPGSLTHARYVCKRLKHIEGMQLVVGLWDTRGDLTRLRNRLTCVGATSVVSTFIETLEVVRQIAYRLVTQAPSPPLQNHVARR